MTSGGRGAGVLYQCRLKGICCTTCPGPCQRQVSPIRLVYTSHDPCQRQVSPIRLVYTSRDPCQRQVSPIRLVYTSRDPCQRQVRLVYTSHDPCQRQVSPFRLVYTHASDSAKLTFKLLQKKNTVQAIISDKRLAMSGFIEAVLPPPPPPPTKTIC